MKETTMALINCKFYSVVLSMEVPVYVILPENQGGVREGGAPIEGNCPVLYLLHGFSADESDWIRKSGIERYVDNKNIAVVMPSGLNRFYSDAHDGSFNYLKYVSEELPQRMKQFFHISGRREDTFIAGLSMGGYGAFKLALNCPEKYCAAASLSGALDIVDLYEHPVNGHNLWMKSIFGELNDLKGSVNDLRAVAKQLKTSGKDIPMLYQCCGMEDFIYGNNVKFRDYLKTLNYNWMYEEGPGIHDWNYWDAAIQRVLNWLPIRTH
jgi:putative tributyrin esterase